MNGGGMSDLTINDDSHLPECPCATAPEYTVRLCVCDRLRACEQRVVAMRKDNGELWLDGYGTGFQDGHTFALDAAEAAVAEVPRGGWGQKVHEYSRNCRAAIDALREGRP